MKFMTSNKSRKREKKFETINNNKKLSYFSLFYFN